MYLLSILLFMVVCVVYSLRSSMGNIVYYIDMPSLLLLFLIVLPILISAGLFKDFNNAFKLSVKRKETCSRTELLRAIEAVNLVIKALWAAGIFNSVFLLIQIMATWSDIQLIRGISVSLITLIYAIFFIILLLPLRSRLLVRLHEMSDAFDVSPAASAPRLPSHLHEIPEQSVKTYTVDSAESSTKDIVPQSISEKSGNMQ